jgi:hypothetical protein
MLEKLLCKKASKKHTSRRGGGMGAKLQRYIAYDHIGIDLCTCAATAMAAAAVLLVLLECTSMYTLYTVQLYIECASCCVLEL